MYELDEEIIFSYTLEVSTGLGVLYDYITVGDVDNRHACRSCCRRTTSIRQPARHDRCFRTGFGGASTPKGSFTILTPTTSLRTRRNAQSSSPLLDPLYLIQVAEDIGFSKEAGRVQVAQLVDLAMSHYNPKLSPSEAIRIQLPLSQGGGVRSYIHCRAAKDRGAQ